MYLGMQVGIMFLPILECRISPGRLAPLIVCPVCQSMQQPVQALNEERAIADTIREVGQMQPPPLEVIVVDGGSTDR